MNLTIIGGLAAALVLAAAFVAVFRRLLRQDHARPVEATWLATFSTARYEPMARLLGSADLVFLGEQPGFTAARARRFRSRRRAIFRAYLRCLARDFGRLHRAARMLMLAAPVDRPDYAVALIRHRIQFGRTMFMVQWRLLRNWLGGATVDARPLVEALEAMNAQVRLLAASPA